MVGRKCLRSNVTKCQGQGQGQVHRQLELSITKAKVTNKTGTGTGTACVVGREPSEEELRRLATSLMSDLDASEALSGRPWNAPYEDFTQFAEFGDYDFNSEYEQDEYEPPTFPDVPKEKQRVVKHIDLDIQDGDTSSIGMGISSQQANSTKCDSLWQRLIDCEPTSICSLLDKLRIEMTGETFHAKLMEISLDMDHPHWETLNAINTLLSTLSTCDNKDELAGTICMLMLSQTTLQA